MTVTKTFAKPQKKEPSSGKVAESKAPPRQTVVRKHMGDVDNTLSPHGGELVNRVVADKATARMMMKQCKATVSIRGQIAREIISIAYGFFSPLEGFMGLADLENVCMNMTLASGYVWTIPILFDMSDKDLEKLDIQIGDKVLLEYHNIPMAIFTVDDIYTYDKSLMCKQVYGSDNQEHPGVMRTYAYKDKFLGGKVDLINEPVFQRPFDQFFYTPEVMRKRVFAHRRWKRVVAYHTRSVPHAGHEWLMKCAWFQHHAKAIMVSVVIGEKRIGDCIDECTVLGHSALREAGYFKAGTHLTSILLWDMRYAGPKEAVFHALVRKNMGCSGHIFGTDHASPKGFYGKFETHTLFKNLPDLGIEPILALEWYYCPVCKEVAYSGLCGHAKVPERFSDKGVCSLLSHGVKPESHMLRDEVFETIIDAADRYGFGDGYVTDEYLQKRNPIFMLNKL